MATQLVQLPEVERLSPTCIRILGGNPGKFTLQGTNTYLLGTGRSRLLVDTGEGKPSWIAALRRTLQEEGATVSEVVLTHWHPDHVSGVADLLREVNPDAKIYKAQRDWTDGSIASGVRISVPSASDLDGQQQLDIPDGHEFRAEGATVTAVHTPGHTADHVALLLREEDAMFTGDCVLGHGTAVFEDLGAYITSLRRIAPLFSGRVYPGHGAVIADGPTRVAEYIAHRQQREDQVLQVLRRAAGTGGGEAGGDCGVPSSAGPRMTAMQLVKVIYSDVPEDLHPAAERGVLQILAKLQAEDKVVVEGATWQLRARSPL